MYNFGFGVMIFCGADKLKQGYMNNTAKYIPSNPNTENTATCFNNSIPVKKRSINGIIVVKKLNERFLINDLSIFSAKK